MSFILRSNFETDYNLVWDVKTCSETFIKNSEWVFITIKSLIKHVYILFYLQELLHEFWRWFTAELAFKK